MMNKRYIVLILPLLTLFLGGCSMIPQSEDTTQKHETKWSGALQNYMIHGDISATISLHDIDSNNLYALGAYENLKGEILILDGISYGTRVVGNEVTIDTSINDGATLLVYDNVSSRTTYQLPDNLSGKELEKAIKQSAIKHGVDISKPFPFLLNGSTETLDYHVIDRDPNDNIHTHEKHMKAGYQGTFNNQKVQILGFYSASHQGIFTHHSTFLHMHVRNDSKETGGHIDALTLGSMQISLPN